MNSVGYPTLKSAYDRLSKVTELEIAKGEIDPNQPVIISQEQSEEELIRQTFWETPIILRNHDYSIDHGIFFCGNAFMAWMHEGELYLRRDRYIWNAKGVLSVDCYDAMKATLGH